MKHTNNRWYARNRTRPQRSLTDLATITGLGFLGLTATGGGVEMLASPQGTRFVPGRWLDDVPLIESWTVPGLVLGGAFGVGSLVTAVGAWRNGRTDAVPARSQPPARWPWVATLGIGVGLAGWIGLELAVIPERSGLEVAYGLLAIGLSAVASGRLRHADTEAPASPGLALVPPANPSMRLRSARR